MQGKRIGENHIERGEVKTKARMKRNRYKFRTIRFIKLIISTTQKDKENKIKLQENMKT